MNKFDVADKTVLITGASSGVGRSLAIAYAKEGARLALVGRNEKALAETCRRVKEVGGSGICAPFIFDLARTNKIAELTVAVKDRLGQGIEVLVNNAAYAVEGLVEDCPIDEYKKNFDVNFYAPIALIQSVLPDMMKKRAGQIINVSSGLGLRALPGISAYSATKFALNALTESLRLEVRSFGIDVICIFPGRVESCFHENVQSYGKVKRTLPNLGKKIPDEIAKAIVRASKFRKRSWTANGAGKLGYHLNYWAPHWADYIIEKKFPVR